MESNYTSKIKEAPCVEEVHDKSDESSFKDRFMPEGLQSADVIIEFKTHRACDINGNRKTFDWSRPAVYDLLKDLRISRYTVRKVKRKKAYLSIKSTHKES